MSTSPLLGNYRSALADPNWCAAMANEYQALSTTTLGDSYLDTHTSTPGANIMAGKRIFKHKIHSNGSLVHHKARWVLQGFNQQHDVYYDETFSPVVKPATIRVVLSIAPSQKWPIHQLSVKNAFLHANFEETLYCQQPFGFVSPLAPDFVCLLQKSLYGHKQAPRV
jgi:hypothetical protein